MSLPLFLLLSVNLVATCGTIVCAWVSFKKGNK